MILVTGATGPVGRHLLTTLRGDGAEVRALSRRPETANLPHGVQVVGGELGEPASLARALTGVEAVYLFSAGRAAGGFAASAVRAGVKRVVVVSGLDDDPADVERPFTDAGLEWTHLRPNAYASNALRHWGDMIRYQGAVRVPYPDAATAPVHEADLAAVAAIVLRGGHAGRRYSLTGPRSLTFREQVGVLARALGRELALVEETPDQARERMSRYGMPGSVVDELLTMWAATAGTPAIVSPVVEQLTGLPARSFARWADEHADDFR
ncbi:NAD(P)H-binding protein [Streptosporangium sp. NPDC020145]|uniref:NAD(P)H-binding protein n=1 Tax=Streptosporangium sp. NPDC020145 TaxID=3154694 RepID=UPI003414D3B4